MAFVSEIRARLGLDTTPFSRALTKTQADVGRAANDMGKKLRRSFGAGDLFKGLLQGIGIGSVQAIIDTVTAPFRRGAEDAERMANESAAMLDIFRQQQLALAGQAQRFEILKKKVSEVNQDIKVQEKLVSDLEANPINLISPGGREEVQKAKEELSRLRIEAAKADAQVKTEIALTNRRTDEWAAASLQREQMRKLELDLLDEENETIKEIQRSELRLFQVSESLAAERKKGSISTSETNALLEEQSQLLDRITTLGRIRAKEDAAARQSALADAAALGQGMTGRPIGAGGGRAAGIRPRGRTESERIADRAALNLAATQDALAKGDVARAGSRANAAAADFIRAGSMQARAAAGISPETANIIGGDIKAAVDSLKAIQTSLLPTQTR